MTNAEKFKEVFGFDGIEDGRHYMCSTKKECSECSCFGNFLHCEKFWDSEYKGVKREIHKCRECKWLSDHHKVIGYECVNPNKKFRNKATAKYKYTSTPACKLFEDKGANESNENP